MSESQLPGSLDLLIADEPVLDLYAYGPWRVPDGLIDELSARIDALVADRRSSRLTLGAYPGLRAPVPAVVADVVGIVGFLCGDAGVRGGNQHRFEWDLVRRFRPDPNASTDSTVRWAAPASPWRPPGGALFRAAGDDPGLREVALEVTVEILRRLADVPPWEARRQALLALFDQAAGDADLMDATRTVPLIRAEWMALEERWADAASDDLVQMLPELTGTVGYLSWVVDGWTAAHERLAATVTGADSTTTTLTHLLIQAGITDVPAELAVGVRGEFYAQVQAQLPALARSWNPRLWAGRIRAWLARGLVAGEFELCRAWLDLAVRLTGGLQGLPGTPVTPRTCDVPVGWFQEDVRRLFRVRRVRHPLTGTTSMPGWLAAEEAFPFGHKPPADAGQVPSESEVESPADLAAEAPAESELARPEAAEDEAVGEPSAPTWEAEPGADEEPEFTEVLDPLAHQQRVAVLPSGDYGRNGTRESAAAKPAAPQPADNGHLADQTEQRNGVSGDTGHRPAAHGPSAPVQDPDVSYEQASPEQPGAEPLSPEPPSPEPPSPEQTSPEQASPDEPDSEQSNPESVSPDEPRSDEPSSAQPTPEQPRPDQASSEQASSEQASPEPADPEPAQEEGDGTHVGPSAIAQALAMIDTIVGQPALAAALREALSAPDQDIRLLVAGPPGTGKSLTVDVLARLLTLRGFDGTAVWLTHEQFARLSASNAVTQLRDRIEGCDGERLVAIDGLDQLVSHGLNGKALAEELHRLISVHGSQVQIVAFGAVDGYRRLVDASPTLAAWWRVVRTRDFDANDYATIFGRVVERRGATTTSDAARAAGDLLAATPTEGQLRNAGLATYLADLAVDAASRRTNGSEPLTVEVPDLPAVEASDEPTHLTPNGDLPPDHRDAADIGGEAQPDFLSRLGRFH
ncbi:hypothetical protein [Actinopolymorpha alba]|uniref:hypothetical protein n=1 Tax=Actinopolymorpha alba TaxID=533267 RepID=UPI0003671FD1|nr:hypothetical protein [Actinopolymorpha alba]